MILSGHYTPFLVASGFAIALAIALLGLRLGYADEEGHPVDYILHGLVYWPWLVYEMALSAYAVARIIVDPKLPISPRLIRVRASQRTTVGIATYANSLTLTSGSIAVEINRRNHEFLVHVISAEAAESILNGEMDRRVRAFEGRE